MILPSSLTMERSDAKGLLSNIKKLQEGSNILNMQENWNGFNILHSDVGRISALELGITSKKPSEVEPAKVIFLLGADNFRHEEIPNDAFVIY